MQTLVLWMVSLMITSLTFAQGIPGKEVPVTVVTAFQKQYPEVKKVTWEKEEGNFEAEFKTGKTVYAVVLDTSGNIVETEISIPTDELPLNAREYISNNHPQEKIKEATKITDAQGNITYEAELKDNELFFDHNGNLIKTINAKKD